MVFQYTSRIQWISLTLLVQAEAPLVQLVQQVQLVLQVLLAQAEGLLVLLVLRQQFQDLRVQQEMMVHP
jgi:hypothetical protein